MIEPEAEELARTAADRWARLVASGEVEMLGEPSNEAVVILAFDPRWALIFEELRVRLTEALGPVARRVDHVGSTAIPGLAAKPVIDVQVSVPDVDDEDAYRGPIEQLGFPMRSREPGHRYFRTPKGAAQRIQVHVCALGSDWERKHLLFRDYLRHHPAEVGAYARLKRALAARYGEDRLAYTDGKTPFIRASLARAESWAHASGWRP